MPLLKSKSKKAMSKNIETEMDAGKPQKQSIAIAYSMMRRAKKKKMAEGGLIDPEHEKSNMEADIDTHSPIYDNRKQADPKGYSSTIELESNEHEDNRSAPDNTDDEDESLQQRMLKRPNDKEDRSNVLFDGKAERLDPLKKEYREDQESIHLGRQDLDEADRDADDIVSRIMRKMRRK